MGKGRPIHQEMKISRIESLKSDGTENIHRTARNQNFPDDCLLHTFKWIFNLFLVFGIEVSDIPVNKYRPQSFINKKGDLSHL
ncbi:hypothetical protein CEXT_548491 [Caerostris extrusa]|uniref:Uncharacterized protein n=1 Tax=Caerostris extrusa TaxID=172846 RepID=A0AAV4MRN8_CAEEX|nr:hypothetical protein CEXT_548491 [Caerostris extrusa]